MKVGILMLTYNAPRYVIQSILNVKRKTSDINYELIVVDNRSKWITRAVVKVLKRMGMIDKLVMNKRNELFARGNNIAKRYVSSDVTHYLLLNSDIKIINKDWLKELCHIHPENGGISAFGAVMSAPIRSDGYCMLIDRSLYDKYCLDENLEWWWSVTKLESQVLQEGKEIKAVKNHERLLHHCGGASGKGFKNAKGMDVELDEVLVWFENAKQNVEILEKI